jgi:hypothetical protein
MKKAIIGFVFIFCFVSINAQTKLDSLKALGRDSLIKLAVKKLNEPTFNPANYDLITVKANATTLLVEFDLSVRLISPGSCYYHSVTVSLYGHGSGGSIIGDCDNVKYYNPSSSDKKSIDFVFNAINKSEEIGHIPGNKLNKGTTMEITEKPTYYYVEVSSWSTFSHYKVSKATGKISEAAHKHYDRSGEREDEFVEIK